MQRKIKNQILPVLKKAVGNYHTLEYETKNRGLYPNDDDCKIKIYQLDSEGKRTDTIHPIDDICAVAQAFKVHIYVTKEYGEDYIYVSIF